MAASAAAAFTATAAAAGGTGRLPVAAAGNPRSPLLFLPPLPSPHRRALSCSALSDTRRFSQLVVKATSSEEGSGSVQVEELFSDLKEKWDGIDNKSTVLVYGGGALVAVWLSSIVIGAINSVPLLPKIMELVGLGYTGWFVYRYLLFKSSRKELASDIEDLKKKIAGTE
ncbi:unnamed protein product [Spirodela intermedia]|uniref:Cyanobacterial aminoacyl-tRNA synthetase CAAD domain-containing protein n=2 Tax=Spirodela intermedia TaxID=51605 RepID=A0A7I8KDF4_SPIIN|nr:unnamed protein product [Spirodela intermedia]CAA6659391.1 unnamed protein product [Spirodela intermedia]CAA7395703.1 unnamed protein product [Spirodela intermedia]